MKVTYDKESKELRVVATNLEEQDELAGVAAVMRHGDICTVDIDDGRRIAHIGGTLERRLGNCLTFSIALEVVISCEEALREFFQISAATGRTELIYLWTEEDERDGWNVLLFMHQ